MAQYEELHSQLYDAVSDYLKERVCEPQEKWEQSEEFPEEQVREIFREMGSMGFIAPWAPEEYGGLGADLLSSCVIAGTIGKVGATAATVWLHGETAVPYLDKYGTEEQKQQYMVPAIAGEKIICIAMTEPDCGSDLAAMKTTAHRDGDDFVINGNKCFISNGTLANTLIIAAKTGPDTERGPQVSLFIVDDDTPGLTRRRIHKIGGKCMDTAELFFEDMRVPASRILGEENRAYPYLLANLQHERLMAAANYQGLAERALDLTVEYVKERKVFGKRLADFQNTSFKLAEIYTRVLAGRALVKDLSERMDGATDLRPFSAEVSAAKAYTAALVQDASREGAQLHGGYGICQEYEIGRIYASSMMYSMAAGTTEIMKMLVGRTLLPREKR